MSIEIWSGYQAGSPLDSYVEIGLYRLTYSTVRAQVI